MWKTASLLIFTLIVVPLIALQFDEPLTILQNDTLRLLVYVYLVAAALCFLISTLSKNYSQVDKLWSIIPVLYVWIVCFKGNFEPRLIIMASLVSIWGIRLTYNFSRRGGYSWKFWEGDEDYRWAILMAKPEFKASWKWMLFNFFFISLYQMALILLFTIPILKSMEGNPLYWTDYLLSVLILGMIAIETLADQQQWSYQKDKYRHINDGDQLQGKYKKGFVHDGLWGIVRHPNYAAEQAIWIIFYLFSVVATGHWINWSLVGCLLLVLLFKGSSDFSEAISAEKYAEYKEYQKKVPRFLPF